MTRFIQSHGGDRGGNPGGPWWSFIADSKTVIFRNLKKIQKYKSLITRHFRKRISVIYGFSSPRFSAVTRSASRHPEPSLLTPGNGYYRLLTPINTLETLRLFTSRSVSIRACLAVASPRRQGSSVVERFCFRFASLGLATAQENRTFALMCTCVRLRAPACAKTKEFKLVHIPHRSAHALFDIVCE